MKGLLLLGLAAAGVAVFIASSSHAKAGAPNAVWPTGWTPPAGASTQVLPTNPTGLTLGMTSWSVAADAGGTAAGTYKLFQNTKSPATDWVVFFNGTLFQQGTTPNSALIAQAVAANLIPGALA